MNRNASQSDSSRRREARRTPAPLTAISLRDLALAYVARFATTRVKLSRYLARKLAERGWDGPAPPDVDGLAQTMVDLGYIDDAAFAEGQARSLARRGYGRRRIDGATRAAGVADDQRAGAERIAAETRVSSALKLAQRRRWGPYAQTIETDPVRRDKMVATFLRAGHDAALARRILTLAPGEIDGLCDD